MNALFSTSVKKEKNVLLKSVFLLFPAIILACFIGMDAYAADSNTGRAVVPQDVSFTWAINHCADEATGTASDEFVKTKVKEVRFETSSKVSSGMDISDTFNESVPVYVNYDNGVITVSTAADKIYFTNAESMFYENHCLKKIVGLENCDFSSCRSFSFMFAECESLEELDLSSVDISSAEECEAILYDCCVLGKLKTFASSSLKYDLPHEMQDEKGNRFYQDFASGNSKELFLNGWVYTQIFDEDTLGVEYKGGVFYYDKGVRRGYDPSRPDWPGEELYDKDEDAYYFLDNSESGARVEDREIRIPVTENGQTTYKNVYYAGDGKRAEGWYLGESEIDPDTGEYYYRQYWYEKGVKQGYDPDNPSYRGKEIYDPESDAWYWLDNVLGGAMAYSKDVYQESLAGEWGDIAGEDGQRYGKWVRYDGYGHMIKGWQIKEDGTYYFDPVYGTMAKGEALIENYICYFNKDTGVLESKTMAEVRGLLMNERTDPRIAVNSVPVDLSGAETTENNPLSVFYASVPKVVTFTGNNDSINVAYYSDSSSCVVVRKTDLSGETIGSITLEKRGSLLGNVIQDEAGYYYAIWGNEADNWQYDTVTMIVSKYGSDGTLLGELSLKGSDTECYPGDEWGTQVPFEFGNCSLAVNKGVLAVNYGRQMYSGHQSNMIIYVNTSDMTKKEAEPGESGRPATETAYTSHSFDQRIIATSDGGFLALNQGDADSRAFGVTRIGEDLTGRDTLWTFHFREGGNRAYGYNETYAQAGGLAELAGSYVILGGSERTLSRDVSTMDNTYLAHAETRDLFVQFINKDYDPYLSEENFLTREENYVVKGENRLAEGERSTVHDISDKFFLSYDTIDYCVVWLTAYDNAHYAANPKIVKLSDDRFAVLWEKREIKHSYSVPEVFYAEIDGAGHVVAETTRLNGVRLAADAEPALAGGVIYWATNDSNGQRLNMVRTSLAGEGGWSSEGGNSGADTDMSADTNGWVYIGGVSYWYENGVRQGYDPLNPDYRGKEIYDPDSNAWYWLDNVQQGAKAVSKDVYQESLAGDWGDVAAEDGNRYGKWVRYDENGHMIKGWNTNENGTYYFDPVYGTMAKGEALIDGVTYHFDINSGVLQ